MRLPNGYGSITKLRGRRRKPWLVRVPGEKIWNEEKQDFVFERAILGYYATRPEAIKALSDFNESPFSVKDNNITFSGIYELLRKEYEGASESTKQNREVYFNHCRALHDVKIKDIQFSMLQKVVDDCDNGSASKKVIKSVMNSVFKYAVRNNLVSKNYVEFIHIKESDPVIDRIVFSKREVEILWANSSHWDVQVVLILLYSGMRVNEFLKNVRANVNFEEKWIYISKDLAKNNASVRYVPLHEEILPFVKHFYYNSERFNKENLAINPSGSLIIYQNFVNRNLKKINQIEGMTPHKFHDTRHSFVTQAYKLGMDDLKTKKIIGHSPSGITKKVYTHITHEDLYKEINKLCY